MSGDYEKNIQETITAGGSLPKKLDMSIIKYFWQAGPLGGVGKDSVPKFLRKIHALRNFSDNELRIMSKYLHLRSFADGEVIFSQGSVGVGFYFLYSGHVGISVSGAEDEANSSRLLISLEKYDYFGELALLQDNSIRSATAEAKGTCQLLGIFKPDVEQLIIDHPIVATKLLQSVSVIIANRLHSITKEVGALKYKIAQLEKENGSNK
jgi:CRP/FNR family cyclic AMP-dependent transcriptional regulator